MSARDRRDARIAEAHARATAPARWVCRLPECPEVDVWHPAQDKEAAERAARSHYARNHYRPPLDSARPTA